MQDPVWAGMHLGVAEEMQRFVFYTKEETPSIRQVVQFGLLCPSLQSAQLKAPWKAINFVGVIRGWGFHVVVSMKNAFQKR